MRWVSMVRIWAPRFFWTENLGLTHGGVVLERRRVLDLSFLGEPRHSERPWSGVLDRRRCWANEAEGWPTNERRRTLPVGTAMLARRDLEHPFFLKCLLKKVSIVTGGTPNNGC